MITVAGTVFSLTMVVLSLTSQQYGPLVLSHFMRDRGNQFVLGVFTATFLYCLLILRTIRGVEDSVFVPHISVLSGLGLSITSLAVLIYFVHHVSQSIQAPNIIAHISDDLAETIDDLFPAKVGQELSPTNEEITQKVILQRFDNETYAIKTSTSGYLQMVDDDSLLKTASKHQIIIHLDVLLGRFLFKQQILARILPKEQASDEINNEIQDAFIFGRQRTRTQDVEFVVTQLSALAVRSLSPGINDPFTAIMVIDHLGEALSVFLEREQPSMYRYDQKNQLRVIAYSVTFEMVFYTAFDEIKHYGNSDPKVAIRLLSVFRELWGRVDNLTDRIVLESSIHHLYEESKEHLSTSEQQRLKQLYMTITRDFKSHQEEIDNATK